MAEERKIPYKIYLEESEMPKAWYNVRADMINKPAPMLDPETIADMARRANMAVVMKYALVLISSAPMLIAYPFVQKYFVKGMMIGSVKG